MTNLNEIPMVDAALTGREDAEASFGCLDTVWGGLPLWRLAVAGSEVSQPDGQAPNRRPRSPRPKALAATVSLSVAFRVVWLLCGLLCASLPAATRAQETYPITVETTLPIVLVEMLKSDYSSMCIEAAKELGKIGHPAVVPALVKALEYENKQSMLSPRKPREHCRPDSRDTRNNLNMSPAERHKSAHSDVYRAITEALKNIRNPAAVPALVEALKKGPFAAREPVAEALGKIGDSAIVPDLVEILKNGEADLRESVAKILGEIGDPAAAPALVQAFKTDNSSLREALAEALRKIGGDPAAFPALVEGAQSGDLLLWRVIYSTSPPNAEMLRVLRTSPMYWLLSPMTWGWLLLIWAGLVLSERCQICLSTFNRLGFLAPIIALPVGWLFHFTLWPDYALLGVLLLGLSLVTLVAAQCGGAKFGALIGMGMGIMYMVGIGAGMIDTGVGWVICAAIVALVGWAIFDLMKDTGIFRAIVVVMGTVMYAAMGAMMGVFLYPKASYWSHYFSTTVLDSVLLISAVLLAWLVFGLSSVFLNGRFRLWLKARK